MYKLFGRRGWGSVLVEAQLAWYGLPFTIEEVDDLFASAAARARLGPINPVAQVPTLLLPRRQRDDRKRGDHAISCRCCR